MIYRGNTIEYPGISKISFSKLIEKLKTDAGNNTQNNLLLKECESFPELSDGIGEHDFDQNNVLIQKLCSTLFPYPLRNNEIKGIIPPFEFRPFYMSERFQKLLENSGADFSFEVSNFSDDQMYIFGCAGILSFHYHYPFLMTLPIVTSIRDNNSGISRTFRVVMNGDLLEILPTEKAPAFTHTDYLELLADFNNIHLWKTKFPPDSWVFKGIGVINLFDITLDHAIQNITSNLLINSQQNLQEILPDLEIFLGTKDLNIGFLYHKKDAFARDITGFDNIILQKKQQLSYKENLCAPSYQKLIVQQQAVVITDVEAWNSTSSCSVVSSIIGDLSFGSYLLIPVKHNDELLGHLELASPETYALNGSTLVKLNVLLPTLGMAISRNRNELQNRKEAVIQQNFTAIHPSVKWRFEEEALTYIQNKESDLEHRFDDILFSNVYALYGQFDIRNSSNTRNTAVQGDLLLQMQKVERIIREICDRDKSPILEEMLFRVQNFVQELEEELFSGSEQLILSLLSEEIHPLFEKIRRQNENEFPSIAEYFSLLHPELNIIYGLRKNYDSSVTTINQFLSTLLDKEQEKAQDMFPHYFERYKTDGIEYNLYIGNSITNLKEFSLINLQNLQLWQLITTCEIERKYADVKATLALPLDIASLILVYSIPLSIHFRVDEKRFDVAGAYNARYEIVKKRIDKACIKGTNERITSPGKIVIIYTSPQDAVIYERYISFLNKKNYISQEPVEHFDVEELPGITGLKAIRVSINFGS